MQKSAVVAGHICLDMIPMIDHHFDLVPGRLYEVGAPAMATGGAVSNTGITMHILGVPVTLMGKVGDDNFGQVVRDIVSKRDKNLAEGMTVSPNEITSYSVVVNIPGIDRIFLHCPGANATYKADDVNWGKVAETALFHFGYPCFMAASYADGGRELKKMYRKAKELGVTTSMDPGMPDAKGPAGKVEWKKLLCEVLPDVDVFMPSADELLYMMTPERFGEGDNIGADTLSALGDELLGMGCAVVAIKLGKRGMYVKTAGVERLKAMGRGCPANAESWADKELIFPVFKVDNFMGATGAGDSSIAGFLSAMLKDLPLERAGLIAAAVGACNVEAPDSLSGIRTWEETEARIDAGWETIPADISQGDWILSPDNIWVR